MPNLLLALLLGAAPCIAAPSTAAVAIAAQTDPTKLSTLKGERAANPRLQKCVYWLAYAEERGEKPEDLLDESAKLNKTAGTPYAGFVRWGLLENLKIAKDLGLLTPEGMAELRRGKSATITKGEYAGQEAEADHVIPRALCPELANQVMNLELLPASLNRAESDKVTDRASVFAKELYDAKLLSEEGWEAVRKAYKNEVVVQPPPLVEIEAPEQNPVRDEPPPPLSIPFIPPLNMGAAVNEGLTETTGEWTYIVGDVAAIVASSTATGAVTIPRKLGGLLPSTLLTNQENLEVFQDREYLFHLAVGTNTPPAFFGDLLIFGLSSGIHFVSLKRDSSSEITLFAIALHTHRKKRMEAHTPPTGTRNQKRTSLSSSIFSALIYPLSDLQKIPLAGFRLGSARCNEG